MATATAKTDTWINGDGVAVIRVWIGEHWVGTIYPADRPVLPYDGYCHRGGGAKQCATLGVAIQFILRCAANMALPENLQDAA